MWKKGIKIWVLSLVLYFLVSGGVLGAKGVTQKIEAVFRGIAVYINGQPVVMPTEPFIIAGKGVTMVPVRSIGEALGLPVVWDEEASAIYIGTSPVQEEIPRNELTSRDRGIPTAQRIEEMKVLRNVGPFYREKDRQFRIASRPFASGVAVEINDSPEEEQQAEVVLELYSKYKSFEGYFGVEDETSNSRGGFVLTIYGDDRELFRSKVMKPSDYPFFLGQGDVDIRGVDRLKFHVQWKETGIGDYGRVIATLANFKFYQ